MQIVVLQTTPDVTTDSDGENMNDYSKIIHHILGEKIEISAVRPVSGGDINSAFLMFLSDGTCMFLKENSRRNMGFFRAEAAGLDAIRKTEAIRVPEVIEVGTQGDNAYLLMEYMEPAPKKRDYWERFGRQLAEMHKADTAEWTPGGHYGFTADNYIGAGGQINRTMERWVDFFRECRLEVQYKKAYDYFDSSSRKAMQGLLDRLDRYLIEPAFPSLLHGDLWGGNFVTGPDGYACLIDPAVYVGHAEADLAMTELFGGFAPAFYDAYREVNEVLPGYADRREIYNLYHLLNHLNLFGSSYYGAVMRIVKRW